MVTLQESLMQVRSGRQLSYTNVERGSRRRSVPVRGLISTKVAVVTAECVTGIKERLVLVMRRERTATLLV